MGNQKGSPKGKHSISQMIKDLPLFFRKQAYPNSFGNQACRSLLDLKALEAQSQMKEASGFKPLTSAQYLSQLWLPWLKTNEPPLK